MSNNKWTVEPWVYKEDLNTIMFGPDQHFIGECWPVFSKTQGAINARRIVAAVNACQGIPTGYLEDLEREELKRMIILGKESIGEFDGPSEWGRRSPK